MLFDTINYNPDVLSCLANLSSDEVFTPPAVANNMLDLLPEDLWQNPEARFLDPVSKSGVFLREIAKRLLKGLEAQIPDLQTRADHIFTRQLFGMAPTELTALVSRRSLYCSKEANGEYSICEAFDNPDGNIRYKRLEHTWLAGRCTFCGASEEVYSREDILETHAYQFIHTEDPTTLYSEDMRFDVVIGNPPYQLGDGGHGRSASPIYHKFVEQAKILNPNYLIMIIPARWYAGGKGLDEFRREMLNDNHIRKIVDFENSSEVFPGVDVAGGICYFLRDRDNPGLCEVVNNVNGVAIGSSRSLNEFSILIRHSSALPIIRKVLESVGEQGRMLNQVVSSSKPFGIRGHHQPSRSGIRCFFTQRQGILHVNEADIDDKHGILNQYKLLIPRAPIAGQTDFSKPVGFYYDGNVRIANPNEICTESWIVAFASESLEEVLAFKSYLFTKTFRFLLLQTVVSQDVTRNNFQFIPDLGTYEGTYTDALLRERWGITDAEWAFIDSKIKAVTGAEAEEILDETE